MILAKKIPRWAKIFQVFSPRKGPISLPQTIHVMLKHVVAGVVLGDVAGVVLGPVGREC